MLAYTNAMLLLSAENRLSLTPYNNCYITVISCIPFIITLPLFTKGNTGCSSDHSDNNLSPQFPTRVSFCRYLPACSGPGSCCLLGSRKEFVPPDNRQQPHMVPPAYP